MKKIIILLTCILATSLFSMAQDPIDVENVISGTFKIKAVYTDGSTFNTLEITMYPGTPNNPSTGVISYEYPPDPQFTLSYFKVYTVDCSPTLSAEFNYLQSDEIIITDCGRCGQNMHGQATYYAEYNYLGIRCHDD